MTENNEQLNIDTGTIIDDILKKKRQNNIRTIIVCAIVFVVVVSLFAFITTDLKTGNAKDMLKQIESDCEAGDYIAALSGIETFSNKYADDSKKITKRVEEIKEDIEEDVYKQLKNSTSSEDYQLFIQIYPDSKHVDEINKQIPLLQAEEEIIKAKEHIDSGESEKAKELLENIIKNANVSEQQKGKAKELLDSITADEEVNSYNHFNMTRVEFIERFNVLCKESDKLTKINTDKRLYGDYNITENNRSAGVTDIYCYDLTLAYTYYGQKPTEFILIYVDKNDMVMAVRLIRRNATLTEDIHYADFKEDSSYMYLALLRNKNKGDFERALNIACDENSSYSYSEKNWFFALGHNEEVSQFAVAINGLD